MSLLLSLDTTMISSFLGTHCTEHTYHGGMSMAGTYEFKATSLNNIPSQQISCSNEGLDNDNSDLMILSNRQKLERVINKFEFPFI